MTITEQSPQPRFLKEFIQFISGS